jgi:hypothetical protein
MRPGKAFLCPHCGEVVPAGALACPECGSDSASGWSEEAQTGLGDPPVGYGDDDDDFDYDDFLRSEGLGQDASPSRADRQRALRGIVVVILIASVLAWLVLR